jgi:hypothetical protein
MDTVDGLHVDRQIRGTSTTLWTVSWTISFASYLRIMVDGWKGTLKYSKWGRFGDEGRSSAVQNFRNCSWGNVIHWKRSFYTACPRIMFSFLRSYIKKRRCKLFWRAESFSKLIICLFSFTYSVSDSSTELVHPDSMEQVFDVLSFVLNTLITLLLSFGNTVYDFDMLRIEEMVI